VGDFVLLLVFRSLLYSGCHPCVGNYLRPFTSLSAPTMVKRNTPSRRRSGPAQRTPQRTQFVFEPGEQRLRLDDLFKSVTLEAGEVEGSVEPGTLLFPPSSARVLGWIITVTSVNAEVQFRTGVGHAKTARVIVPCPFPRPAGTVEAPEVSLVGPECTTFGVFATVTVVYKPQ